MLTATQSAQCRRSEDETTGSAGHSERIATPWVEKLMREAGSLTLHYFRKNLRAIEKPFQQGIVTEADIESEKLIKELILKDFPESQFLAEESTEREDWSLETGWSQVRRSAFRACPLGTLLWIIDPVDGTTNFSKGNPYFAISVCAGTMTQDGRFAPEFGAVLHPPSGDFYFARPGRGATINGERMHCKERASLETSSICTGFGYQTGEILKAILDSAHAIQQNCLGMRINGAAALDLALTARGLYEGFYEYRLKPWDMAAGAILARESGLSVWNFDGQPYETLDHSSIIVAHPQVDRELRDVLDQNFRHLRSSQKI